jgi:hypothetical protein
VLRSGQKKGGQHRGKLERLNDNFSQSQEQLLRKMAIERGRLVKKNHKQEKQKEMTQGQDCLAREKGAQAQQPLVATPPRF